MSVFKEVSTKLNDEKCLVSSLKTLGYEPEVSESKQIVRGHGIEKLEANVILKKEDTQLKGDIGFNKMADGTYNLVYDTYVIPKSKLDPKEFIDKVSTEFCKTKIRKQMAAIPGYKMVQEKTTNGETKIKYVQVGV